MDQSAKQPEQGIGTYLFRVGAKKASWAVAKFLTSIVTSVVVMNALHKYGVTVDPQVFMTATSIAVMAGLEFAHDYLKVKIGLPFL